MRQRASAFLPVCVVIVAVAGNCNARTQPTTESRIAGRIASVMQFYINENRGLTPTNWSQLSMSLVENNRELLENQGEVIPTAYVFTPTNLCRSGIIEGRVLAARCKPIKEEGRKGRYLIYQTLDGDVREDWMLEDEFQEMLTKCHVELPEPDLAAAKEAKAAVERLLAEKRRTHELVVAVAPKPTWAEIRSVWWDRFKSIFIKPPRSSFEEGATRTTSFERVRPVPLALMLIVLFGSGFFICRRFFKNKALKK